jgi:Ca2+-binding EF-hand superfamily protein
MVRAITGISCLVALLLVPASASAQQPCTTDARHVVDEMYRHMLERAPDPGSAGWVAKLSSGNMRVRELVQEIATSPEHVQRFFNPADGPAGNERAVAYLYRHILGRQPDAGGLRSLTNMAATQGLGAVVNTIISSPEYQRTFGDWGVPGSGGLVYCGSSLSQLSQPREAVNNRNRRYDDANLQDRFDYLDVNGNRVIDENEWDGGLEAFDRLDRNNDGRLSRAELGNTGNSSFTSLDLNRDRRIALAEWPWSHRRFDEEDVNGDGVITRDEFRGGVVPTTGR